MKIKMTTEMGDVGFSLDFVRAPVTSQYFVDLLTENELDATSFFRIVAPNSSSPVVNSVPIKVIQFGHWEESHGNISQIEHETTNQTGLTHSKWSLSVARYGPGCVYRSFFVCLRDEPNFDFGGQRHPDGIGFAKFGEVTSGFSVLEGIFDQRSPEEFQDQAVKIIKVRRS